MNWRDDATRALSYDDNGSTVSNDSPDWSPTEKESKVFVGVRSNSTFSAKSVSTLRSNSMAPVQKVLSAVLDEPIGPYRSSEPRPWRARFLRFGPIVGLLSMFVALASIFASFGILASSRGEAVDAWRTTPPTLLAICTAVANLAMRYATIQGVIIAWWTRALRGSSVKRLHEDWRAGTSIRGALTSGNLGLLSIACLVSTIVTIDGPLLQKASSVQPAPITNQPVELNITISPELPRDYSGAWLTAEQDDEGPGTYWADAFNRTSIPSAINTTAPNNIVSQSNRASLERVWAHQWIWGGTVPSTFVEGCDSVCKARIRAPALSKTACRSFLAPVNYTQILPYTAFVTGSTAPPLSLAAFIIDMSLQLHENESIDFVTGFSHNYEGIGAINITACNLVSAVGEYEIIITKDPPSIESAWQPDIVAVANNSQVNYQWQKEGYHYSTLGGIVLQSYNKWASWSSFWTQKNGEAAGIGMRPYTTDFFAIDPSARFNNWTDPHERVMKDLNKLMFVTGVAAAMHEDAEALRPYLDEGMPLKIAVTGYVQGNQNVFATNFHWFIAAAIVELVCILLVLPTYWGWWELGRPMSFSPIEIAKAFDSPLLDQCNSNSSGREIAKVQSDTRLRYGATKSTDKTMVLAFARPELVDRPVKDARFDN